MKQYRSFITWFLLPLAAGISISIITALQLERSNRQTLKAAVKLEATRIAHEVNDRISLYEYGLRGVRGTILTLGQEHLSHELFLRYSITRDIHKEFPGAHGFGFIRKVPQEQEAEFLTKARLDGKPDFTIKQLSPHMGDKYVIQYVEPAETNAAAIGLDTASEPHRREAAEASMRTGTATLTAPITLVQASTAPSQSFLMMLPIYSSGKTPDTLAERESQLIGWSYAPLIINEVLASLSPDSNTTSLSLRDITQPGTADTFFTSAKNTLMPVITQTLEREILGRRWSIELGAYPGFVENLHLFSAKTAFFIGLLFSFLTATLIKVLNISYNRKRAILEEQARIISIVETSIDGIIGKNLDGVITSWNKGAETLFGYSADEAIGKTLASLVIPSDLQHEEADILARIANDEHVPHFTTTRHRKDGSLLTVSVAVAPIHDAKGRIIGASKTVRDITEQQKAQDQILDLNLNLEVQVAQRTVQLEIARRNLQTLLDAVPSMIGYWDKNLVNQVANRAYHEWFGLDYPSIPGMHASQLFGAELFESNRPFMEAALRGEKQTFTRNLVTKEGEKYTLAHYLPDIDQGQVLGFYAIVNDVTQITQTNRQLQKVLRENHALLSTIDTQMLYSATDTLGNIIEANANFCASSGFSRDELIGQNHRLLNSGTHPIEFWHSMWGNITQGQPWRGEVCNRNRNGNLCWFDTVIAPFTNEQGKIERYIALRTDITEKKLAERERNRLNFFITGVLNAATEVAIIATDREGLITVFNRGAELMLGYSAEEVVGKTSPAPFHLMEEIIARGQELSREFNEPIEGFRVFVHKPEIDGSETRTWTYVRKDGSHLQVSLIATPVRDENNIITGYLGVVSDITQDLANRRKIESTLAQLDIAAQVAELGIWTWTLSDNSLHWSERMFDIYDQPKHLNNNGLNYQHWYERVHPDDADATVAQLQAAVEGRGRYDPTFRIVTRNGEVRYVQAGAQIERDDTGKALVVTGINRDITAQKMLEASLLNAKDAADAANASKSTFLANMSHEIRTPMNAVLGMLQLLEHTELNDRQKDYLTKSQGAAKSLLGLLNDILDFSKIDSGKLQLDEHPFELEPLLRDLATILSANQGGKNIEVLFNIDPRLPRTLIADRLRLQQVLINLAGNALKFTHEGQVLVTLKRLEQHEGDTRLHISVSDTGIGISPEQIDRIFEGFVQAEASITRRYGGTGLGLVISKRLVDLMGGELKLESTLGTGSRFWFDIPLSTQATKTAALLIPRQDLSGMRALVVDDVALSREVLTLPLKTLGIHTDEANGGMEALEKVRRADAQNTGYDIVLMDWHMPDLDGLRTAELIHKSVVNKAPPIIIMVTAYAREEIFVHPPTGVIHYKDLLTKPVTPLQLEESIVQALTGAKPSGAKPLDKPRHPLAGLQLLVVEDNELNRQIAFELLVNEGASVELASGGLEGVAKVVDGKMRFDLVIMDMQMPDIDGMEATRRIRQHQHLKTLPILAMTANASADDRAACLAAGMNEHIGKPIDIEQVVLLVLALAGKQPQEQQEPNTKMHQQNNDALVETLTDVLRRFSGNTDLYARMFTNFRQDVNKLLATLEQHIQQSNQQAAAAALHSIKGIASTMGAKTLAAQASTLEKQLKSPDAAIQREPVTRTTLDQLADLLDQSARQLEQALQHHTQVKQAEAHNPQTLSHSTWKEALSNILALLEAGNLSAGDKLEELYHQSHPEQQARLSQLVLEVNNLQYNRAITSINHLLAAH